MTYLYVMGNEDWVDKYKYGITKNYNRRIVDGHEQHSYLSNYLHLWELDTTINMPPDFIFSKIAKNKKVLSKFENKLDIKLDNLKNIRKFLINNGGGEEFIHIDGFDLFKIIINGDFSKFNIKIIKKFTIEEINDINENRKHQLSNNSENGDIDDILCNFWLNEKTIITPFTYQQEILDNIQTFYKNNSIGQLIWCCGLGKSFMALMIIKKMNFTNILIGVSSLYLKMQFEETILKYFGYNNKYNFTITTYHSCHKFANNKFDFKIGDEAHHLVSTSKRLENDLKFKKRFITFHKIKSNKTLFMTATPKHNDLNILEDEAKTEYYSMGDVSQFGEIIDTKSVKWAIENKMITDYQVLITKNTDAEINEMISDIQTNRNDFLNKELFISAFIALQSFVKYKNELTHLLIYVNTIAYSEKIIEYIKTILKSKYFKKLNKNYFYLNSLSSKKYNKFKKCKECENIKECEHIENIEDNKKKIKLKDEVDKFKTSKYGIISTVYIFGEGFDLPKLNGVLFAEKMQSTIRIVQSTLRANRLDKNNKNKKAFVLIPYIEKDGDDMNKNWINNNSFEKCREIISRIGNEDENIISKIKVFGLKKKEKIKQNKKSKKCFWKSYFDFMENETELNKIKLRLIHRCDFKHDDAIELCEYNTMVKFNKLNNLTTPVMYKEKLKLDGYDVEYYEPDEYFVNIWKNWYHYLGVNTSIFIQTKEKWVNECKKEGISNLEEYLILCKNDVRFPDEPEEFYINFTNILNELNLIKRKRH